MAAEIGSKKKRIARIGGMPCSKETQKNQSEDGLIQDDCNLVYNIMQSMNKSQHVMSYQQLQEFRSKEKSTRANNSDQNSSNKLNSKGLNSSKQSKKFSTDKSFPLMEKCQKSMKYLKKNRCIPKPRAHVGYIPRPSPSPTISLLPNNMDNNPFSSNAACHKETNSLKVKQNSCPTEKNDKLKKAQTSCSVDNSCDTNESHKNSVVKKSKLSGDVDTESDDEFELFLMKQKRKLDRKREKNKKFKKKKVVSTKKVAQVTRKKLTTSEDSFESEVECNTPTEKNINVREEFSSKKFQRIVDYENSDSATDTHINDTGTCDNDSFSSSEDENIENKSLNEENSTDFYKLVTVDAVPVERSSMPSAPTFSSECKDVSYFDSLKSKCRIPCYVAIERDTLLDKKVASLLADKNVISNTVSASNPYAEEDDCIIIETSTNNFSNKKIENIAPSIETRNSIQEELAISKSPLFSETSNSNVDKNKFMNNQEAIFSSNGLKPQTATNSNEKSSEILNDGKNLPFNVRKAQKEVSDSITVSKKSHRDKYEYLSFNKAIEHSSNVNSDESNDKSISSAEPSSLYTSNLSNNESDSLNCSSATEKETFNVQILSVKSLCDSDIIVLSDENEENEMESKPPIDETKENTVEDPDVEIICLDSSVNKECANKNVMDSLKNRSLNDVKVGKEKDSSSSFVRTPVPIEDDCIILDDLDVLNKDTCLPKSVGEDQANSQVVDYVQTNSNDEKSKSNSLESNKNSILKLLDSIDFDCINKILNKTSANDTQNKSIAAKTEHSSQDNIKAFERKLDLSPAKHKRAQKDVCPTQKQVSSASITPISLSEINKKKSSLSLSLVEKRRKHPNLIQNSNVLDNINCSENAASSIRRNIVTSSSDYNKSPAIFIDSTVPKSFPSDKEVASNCKTEPDASVDSRKNKESLAVCAKAESYENLSDELDIIAAKSIQNLNEEDRNSIVPLLELYRIEYKRFMSIRCTEQNVSAGLKLLEEKQTNRLLAISSCIKNFVKKDECFHKINNEFGSKTVENDETKKPLEFASQASIQDCSEIEKDDKVRIFNKSVVERASEILRSDGPSSSQEVFNHLINSVCAECGKNAVAACSGCAKIYYCSEKCGMASWDKGHFATCKR